MKIIVGVDTFLETLNNCLLSSPRKTQTCLQLLFPGPGRISSKRFSKGISEVILFGTAWDEQNEPPVNGQPARIIAWDRLPVEIDQSTTEGG